MKISTYGNRIVMLSCVMNWWCFVFGWCDKCIMQTSCCTCHFIQMVAHAPLSRAKHTIAYRISDATNERAFEVAGAEQIRGGLCSYTRYSCASMHSLCHHDVVISAWHTTVLTDMILNATTELAGRPITAHSSFMFDK